MRRYLLLAAILLALPWLIGCKDCEQLQAALVLAKASGNPAAVAAVEKQIADAKCTLPEEPPTTPPPAPAPPVNCLTHPTCPAGQHCEQGVGCVADPLPDPKPPVTCPPGTTPQVIDGKVVGCLPWEPPATTVPDQPAGTTLRMNNRAYGNGLDSTLLVDGSAAYCAEMGWTDGRRACAAAQDDDPRRLHRELKWLGAVVGRPHACPVWQYTPDKTRIISCNDDHDALASCDHFGNTTVRDDPQTPAFEGEPTECGNQSNAFGPFAGFFTIPHSGGQGWARACLPDYSRCGPWVRVKL